MYSEQLYIPMKTGSVGRMTHYFLDLH